MKTYSWEGRGNGFGIGKIMVIKSVEDIYFHQHVNMQTECNQNKWMF